ncbi:nmrA-like family domain-containing protein 1 [Ciconia boyciana]|uniref:nmrA-like family domain-containing protein 1 n=1 Tax=Ciconia boyciana TaxID=52775 RepID=UPI003BA08A9B
MSPRPCGGTRLRAALGSRRDRRWVPAAAAFLHGPRRPPAVPGEARPSGAGPGAEPRPRRAHPAVRPVRFSPWQSPGAARFSSWLGRNPSWRSGQPVSARGRARPLPGGCRPSGAPGLPGSGPGRWEGRGLGRATVTCPAAAARCFGCPQQRAGAPTASGTAGLGGPAEVRGVWKAPAWLEQPPREQAVGRAGGWVEGTWALCHRGSLGSSSSISQSQLIPPPFVSRALREAGALDRSAPTGAWGAAQGSCMAQALLEDGIFKVHAVMWSPVKKEAEELKQSGAEVVKADQDDEPSLELALTGKATC